MGNGNDLDVASADAINNVIRKMEENETSPSKTCQGKALRCLGDSRDRMIDLLYESFGR